MRLVIAGRPLGAMCAGLLFLGLAGCEKEAEKPKVPVFDVDVIALGPGTVRDTGEYLGSLISRQSITLMPQVGGYVRKIHVRPGQQVKAGEPLVEIDARQQSAALESAQAQHSSAQVQLDLAQVTHARTQALYKEGLASAQELEQALAAVKAAEASARSITAQVSQQRVQLGFNVVTAPFDGVVGDVVVRVGDLVGASSAITSLSQADVLEVTVAVPASRARTLESGSPIELLDAKGEVLVSSKVFYVAPVADPVTQLIEVKAAFRNDIGLRPNERVRARVVYTTREALQIPVLAVVRQSGQPFALVIEEQGGASVVNRKPIQLGTLGDAAFVVEGGIEAGARVAVSALHALRHGAKVNATLKDNPLRPNTGGAGPATGIDDAAAPNEGPGGVGGR